MEDEISISNNIESISKEYKINSQQELSKEKENLELLLDIEKDKIRINVLIKEKYIIIVYAKLKDRKAYENQYIKKITISAFGITIIKTNFEDKKENQEIHINIPIKEEKVISKKRFFGRDFYFNDFISINDSNSYLIVYLFSQLSIFKIWQKEGKLIYNKIKIKNFVVNDKNFKPMYLGSNINKNKNILEFFLLLKPDNIFFFIPIDTEKNENLKEKEFKIDEKYDSILNKNKRSYCDKYLFANKNTNQKYILHRDDENNEMIVKELETNGIWHYPDGNEFYYLYMIGDKTYFLAQIPEKSKEEESNNYSNNLIIGIYNVIYDKDKYKVYLSQKIKIKNEDKIKDSDILFNVNLANSISIKMKEKLFFININEKGSIDSINKIKLNTKELEIQRIFSEKFKEWSLLVLFIQEKIYISKFSDRFEKMGKCFTNYESKKKEEEKIEFKTKIITESVVVDNKNYIKKTNNFEEEYNLNNLETLMNEFKKPKENEKYVIDNYNKNENYNKIEIEIEEDNEKEIDNENKMKLKIEEEIQNIINKKMEINTKKLEKLKKEKEKKLKIIKEDIKFFNEENEKFEEKINLLLKRIQKLELKKKSYEDEEEEEEKENEKNIRSDYKKGNSYYYNNNNFNNHHLNNQQNQNQNQNIMNNPIINNYIPINQQQQIINMPNQYNMQNPNMNYNINDPLVQLILNQQFHQQRIMNMRNQSNFNLSNNMRKKNN